jgi:integrase
MLRNHRIRQLEAKLAGGGDWNQWDLVFPDERGKPLLYPRVRSQWKTLKRRLGGEFTGMRFHDLRHAHATLLLHAGVHPKVVSERLGHSSINLTMDTYSHVMKTLQADAIAGLDAMVPLRRSVAEKRSA